jgi:hypothetical protein
MLRRLEELAEQALDLEQAEHARMAFFLVGFLTWEGGDYEATRQRMHRMEATSRASSAPSRVEALASAGRCLVMLERDLPQAHAMLLEAEARARALDLEPVALLDGLGMIEAHRGDVERATTLLSRARHLAEAERDRMHEFAALEHIATLQLDQGDYGAATGTATQLERIGERMRDGSEGPFARALVGVARYGSGLGAEPQLGEGLHALRVVDAKHRLAYVLIQTALLDLAAGEPGRARERALEALPLARLLERSSETLLALVVLARAATDLGDGAGAGQRRAEIAGADWSRVSASVRARHAELLGEALAAGPVKGFLIADCRLLKA